MTDDRIAPRGPSRPLSPVVLGVVWTVVSLVVAAVGWFLFALSESGDDRSAGLVLLIAAGLGLVTAILYFTRPAPALALAASAAFVLGGVVAALLVAAGGGAFLSDVVLVGALPVLAGVVPWLLERRGRAG